MPPCGYLLRIGGYLSIIAQHIMLGHIMPPCGYLLVVILFMPPCGYIELLAANAAVIRPTALLKLLCIDACCISYYYKHKT